MLERQQSQLIAGVQELYKRLQNGETWTGQQLQHSNDGRHLTHKILEGLGVLQVDELDGVEGSEGTLQSLEQQSQDGAQVHRHSSVASHPDHLSAKCSDCLPVFRYNGKAPIEISKRYSHQSGSVGASLDEFSSELQTWPLNNNGEPPYPAQQQLQTFNVDEYPGLGQTCGVCNSINYPPLQVG